MRRRRLAALCLAWYCALSGVDFEWPMVSHGGQSSPFIPPLQEAATQEGRQGLSDGATRHVRVRFGPRRSDVALAGQVDGYETVDYLLQANSRQRLTVRLTGASPYLLMGIYAPAGDALCAETCARQWTGLLALSGDYTIRVGLSRAEARRQGRASFTLHVSLAP